MHAERDDRPLTAHSDQQLLELLDQVEDRVGLLRAEVARRERQQAQDRRNADQHVEIGRLSEYLDAATVNWRHVREFVSSAIREQRDGAPWGESDRAASRGPESEERT